MAPHMGGEHSQRDGIAKMSLDEVRATGPRARNAVVANGFREPSVYFVVQSHEDAEKRTAGVREVRVTDSFLQSFRSIARVEPILVGEVQPQRLPVLVGPGSPRRH